MWISSQISQFVIWWMKLKWKNHLNVESTLSIVPFDRRFSFSIQTLKSFISSDVPESAKLAKNELWWKIREMGCVSHSFFQTGRNEFFQAALTSGCLTSLKWVTSSQCFKNYDFNTKFLNITQHETNLNDLQDLKDLKLQRALGDSKLKST